MRPVRKRKLVDEMRGEWDVSIRRACGVFEMDTSTYHYKSLAALDRPISNNGSGRSARRAFAMAIGGFTSCSGVRDAATARTVVVARTTLRILLITLSFLPNGPRPLAGGHGVRLSGGAPESNPLFVS